MQMSKQVGLRLGLNQKCPNELPNKKMIGNKFSNVCRAIATNILTRVFISNNIFSCQPVATSVGFSNTNKGIGVLQNAAGNSYVYEIIDADPTSATYGLVDTFQYSTASAQPSSGTWVVGAFVSNVAPAPDANNMMIFGWSRRTIGNGNVATTDWMPVRTSLVSPTV